MSRGDGVQFLRGLDCHWWRGKRGVIYVTSDDGCAPGGAGTGWLVGYVGSAEQWRVQLWPGRRAGAGSIWGLRLGVDSWQAVARAGLLARDWILRGVGPCADGRRGAA